MNAPADVVDLHDAAEPRLPKLDRSISLFLDVDGTLIDIAEAPDAVAVPAGLPDTLFRVHEALGGALALVSGRPIVKLDRLFAPFALPAAGEHGAELRRASAGDVEEPPRSAQLPELNRRLVAIAAQMPGVFVETKRAAIAVHYRQASSCGPALRDAVDKVVGEAFPDFHVLPGKMVFEIKQRQINKGTAVLALMERPPFAGRRPLFIGDDTTDEDGFRAARALGGAGVLVGPAPTVEALFCLATPAAVRAWLTNASQSFGPRAGAPSQ